MWITVMGICSIVVGFVCIALAYLSVMRKRPMWIPIVLGLMAALFVTVIPVTLAVFFATTQTG